MSHYDLRRTLAGCVTALATLLVVLPTASAQHTEGRVTVTVTDPQGAVIPQADVTLTDVATNDVRHATTTASGTYTFVNLSVGTYKLTAEKAGFSSRTFESVIVEQAKNTDVKAQLGLATQQAEVQVEAIAPVVEATSNAISTVIDPKQVEDLPIIGRDVTQLSRLSAGFVGTPSSTNSANAGVFNGLPTSAEGNNIDGVVGSPSRMKFGGNAAPAVSPRVENIEEMTVQTDQLDMNQGYGQAAMQVNFVTRRGGDNFHGRAYEDFRNDWLNANSWSNNARGLKRPHLIRNEFGGSFGGPILKNKLFFFASLSALRQPGSSTATANVLNPAAQTGSFTYRGTDGLTHTVNLFGVASAYNTAHGTALPTSVNGVIGGLLGQISSSFSAGTLTALTDPNVSVLSWLAPNPNNAIYPTIRVDYNVSRRFRMNFAVNRTETINTGANLPFFPGSAFASTGTGNKSDSLTAAYGLDWTITPKLINQFKAGWLYNANFFSYNTDHAYATNPLNVGWPTLNGTGLTSPQNYNLPITPYYPVINVSDTVNWQHGSHNWMFGYSYIREQDWYWNPPEGIPYVSLGLTAGDPALDAMSDGTALPASNSTIQAEAQNLYALLTGRIGGNSAAGGSSSVLERFTVDPKTGTYLHQVGAYNLNELSVASGVFAQDSWHMRPTFTLNYGLRWDFTGDNHDLGGAYHNSDVSSIYGPTAQGNLFQPGKLGGNLNPTIDARPHAYNSWNVSPQPGVGFAWAPRMESGILHRMLGQDTTVIRGGYQLRKFTIPYQYFWDNASNFGTFFYQFGTITSNSTPAPGNFTPGSLSLGQALPPLALSPPSYQASAPVSQFTFIGGSPGVNGIKQNIGQPYTESWNFGIQRRLGPETVLEVRYVGNRTLHQWINLNTNEVNIFENGFLQEFKNAQSNLNICTNNAAACKAAQATAGVSAANQTAANFANWGLPGQVALPIMTAAFTGSTTGAQTSNQFRSSTFVPFLTNGAAGSFASRLATNGAAPFLCNMVGSAAFTPCSTNAGLNVAGAGFPINFWQANPYAARGTSAGNTGLMTDAGYSSYNALQVDFRQHNFHGMQFDANYTFGKTLGILPGGSGNDWTGAFTGFTLRNLRDSYVPAAFDARHVVHVNATADLPFGKGKRWANSNAVLDRIVGGWNLGSIVTWQSGFPFRVLGAFSTFNNVADGGVMLNNVTRQQLQDSVGVYRVPGATFVSLINPTYMTINGTSNAGANSKFITPNITPGVFQPPVWLYGPHGFYQDIMITKNVPLTERFHLNLQSEFLNAWNHPVFGQGTNPIGNNILSSSWGTTTGSSVSPRNIELRANFTF